jgi:hypothetical protein
MVGITSTKNTKALGFLDIECGMVMALRYINGKSEIIH